MANSGVKCLNKAADGGRFKFKKFSERIGDIEIGKNVFRLKHVRAESKTSSFFLDEILYWRELNTAEDFISFYDETMPMVQTLPQILLHKENIFSGLLRRIDMKSRLSLEPILMLLAALSRDVLQEFLPFLQRLVDSLVNLLMSGGDRDPDVLEQVFTSWSHIMMNLQKYLIMDIVHLLEVTVHLRYFHKVYVQEFMAEAVSFLLRSSTIVNFQFEKGIRKVLLEVAKNPSPVRKTGVIALLLHVLRRSSSELHSRAEIVLRLLVDKSFLSICGISSEGSAAVLEVITGVVQRLFEEIEHSKLSFVYNCLIEKITSCIGDDNLEHLNRLLSVLTSTVAHCSRGKVYESQPLFELVRLLIQSYIVPAERIKPEDYPIEVLNRILKLMLFLLDYPDVGGGLSNVIQHYAPAFKLKSSGLLLFIKGILLKEPHIVHAFRNYIISAMDDVIEDSPEEVIFLMSMFFERQGNQPPFDSLKGLKGEAPKICSFFKKKLQLFNDIIASLHQSSIQVTESELAMLWGVIRCYPHFQHPPDNLSLLMSLVEFLDQLLETEADSVASIPKSTWQSLLGAALHSCHKLFLFKKTGTSESRKVLCLAEKHKSSSQVLSAVAEILDSMFGSAEAYVSRSMVHDLDVDKLAVAITTFADNLGLPDKALRILTLRILSHYAPLDGLRPASDESPNKKQKVEESGSSNESSQSIDVINLLLLVETTPLSISASRKITVLISRLQMGLSSAHIHHVYIPVVLSGLVGILHNRLSHLWEPAVECLTVLLGRYKELTWNRFVRYLEDYQFRFLSSDNQLVKVNSESPQSSNLDECFSLSLTPGNDSTPCMMVTSLLLQSLQKNPEFAESRSRQLVPLFLKFLGYEDDNCLSIDSFCCHKCTKKEWRTVLKEWLNLFRLMRNIRSLYRSQVLKEVLANRLLDEIDPDIQLKVLDCLLNWKDDFLIPYGEHLKNLISSKSLREELTTWAVSKESQNIDEGHRTSLIPLVIRLLTPKVRKLKTLASRKHASVSHRRALLGFFTQLDVNELHLFFSLLVMPLLQKSLGTDVLNSDLDSHHLEFPSPCQWSILMKHSISMPLANLPWKKQYGFLHVVEDILRTFDELHIRPFLNLLMKIVAQILESCISNITSGYGNNDSAAGDSSILRTQDTDTIVSDSDKIKVSIKQYKDLRSLCLKIVCFALNKFDDHDFASDFWDIFFSSVKPLIDSFKQEGSSSEKPSSLFSCFLAMSQSPKLVSLLDREATLVPTIFSILTVRTASNAIISSVLNFIENLLILDNDSDQVGNPIKRILLPHIGTLLDCFHGLFKSRKEVYRKSSIWSKKTELRIFKLVVKYINDPLAAEQFADVLLPFFKPKALHTAADECSEGLQVIKEILPVLGDRTCGKILTAVHPLLVSCRLDLRLCICDIIDGLSQIDPSLAFLARLLNELNAVSSSEIGEFDYDIRINAYGRIKPDTFSSLREEHALAILSHCVYDMSSEEYSLQQSASKSLLSFIQFAAWVLNNEREHDKEMLTSGGWKETKNLQLGQNNMHADWTKSCIQRIIERTFLWNIGESTSKNDSIQKEWVEILRDMVYNLHEVPSLSYFRQLISDDIEVDFFKNIIHMQIHRRVRALSRFRKVLSAGEMAEDILVRIFVPLFFNMLLNVKDGKGEHLRNACLETLASISGHLRWESYRILLFRCFQEMKGEGKMKKIMIRLICSILDKFHFTNDNSSSFVEDCGEEEGGHEDLNSDNAEGISSNVVLCYSEEKTPSKIQAYLEKVVFPKIKKLLNSDSDKVNVNISLAAIKLLKLLPEETMEAQLPSIIYHICNFLKNRMESARDEARSTLAACAMELGMEKLHVIVKVLKAILKRGFELHVLGYTLNFILSKMLIGPSVGKIDDLLEELLPIAENDILGDVAEQKEVGKIASKMKETRKIKSFETLKLISHSITFKTHALKLLSPIKTHLQKHLTPRKKIKLEQMLDHIAQGIECNPSAKPADLFIFVYGLIQDSITTENLHSQERDEIQGIGTSIQDISGKIKPLSLHGLKNSHLIVVFALGILHRRLKSTKLDKKDEQLLSMLDPFVPLLGNCLNSKYEDVLAATFRCLAPLIKLPLPSLEAEADKIKIILLDIAQKPGNTGSLLVQSCLKMLTVLLRSTKIILSHGELHMLIQFPMFIDLLTTPSPVALSLLKSIVGRKLVVHEIYDVVSRVAELMVTSQSEPIRRKCNQILLQFLLDYHLSNKRLQQHIDFLLTNLSYEHSSGREAVLEMLHAILIKFPKSIVDNQAHTFFLHLVVALANERDQNVRSMVATVLKELIGRASPHALNLILEYSLSWYTGEKQHLWSAAAQVLGLLAEVLKKGFQKHITGIMQVTKNILSLCDGATDIIESDHSTDPVTLCWKEAYYSLVMLEAVLVHFPHLYFDSELEEIWKKVIKFLLHPHIWLRNITSRLIALHFAAVSEAGRANPLNVNLGDTYLVNPSRLFVIAVSLLNQLKAHLSDDATSNLITQNLVFSICNLHSFAKQKTHMPLHEFWSSLDSCEQGSYLEAFELLGSTKTKSMFLLSTHDESPPQEGQDSSKMLQSLLVAPLLKRMGKIAMEMEDIQMKIIFNCFRMASSQIGSEGCQDYAFYLLIPVYKVCEGFAGKVISDDVKQLAEEVRDSIRAVLTVDKFVQVYNRIRKKIKERSDKRKHAQKIMAVVNPMRHAKRKLQIAAKHQAHKRRKITSMKMQKWRR